MLLYLLQRLREQYFKILDYGTQLKIRESDSWVFPSDCYWALQSIAHCKMSDDFVTVLHLACFFCEHTSVSCDTCCVSLTSTTRC
jgi:hypothetical protein